MKLVAAVTLVKVFANSPYRFERCDGKPGYYPMQALGLYARHTGAAFVPYLEEALKLLKKLAGYFHEDVRLQAVQALERERCSFCHVLPCYAFSRYLPLWFDDPKPLGRLELGLRATADCLVKRAYFAVPFAVLFQLRSSICVRIVKHCFLRICLNELVFTRSQMLPFARLFIGPQSSIIA